MNTDTIVADSLSRDFPGLKPRTASLETVPGMASVVIGMRRSGKTCLMFREIERLLAEGVERSRILYVNLEDDRLYPIQDNILPDILESFYRQTAVPRDSRVFIFLDEVQAVQGWSRFARRILDTEKVSLFVTGSSAKMLSSEVATEFRGRGFTTEVFPLSFREYLSWKGIGVSAPPYGARIRSLMEKSLPEYLRRGGFPGVQELKEHQRIQVLQSYVELVILRDIMERHGLGNLQAIRGFVMFLLQSSAGLVSVNKVYRDLSSRGIRVGKETLYELLNHLTDAFLLSSVTLFHRSLRVRQSNPRKVYTVDPGLSFAFSPSGTSNTGRRLEEAVFLQLRRRAASSRPATICYYRTKSGKEVDFVFGDPDTGMARKLIQVCADMADGGTRKREIEALEEAMEETGLRESCIITLFEEGEVGSVQGNIRILPGWKWFLEG